MITDFDIEVFKFIEKLTEKTQSQSNNPQNETSKLKGLGTIIDLGEVSDFGIEEFDEDTYLTKGKFKDVNGKLIGLDTIEYLEFKEFVLKIFESSFFTSNCDFITLFDVSFEWLLEVYKYRQAHSNFITFLIDKIDSLTNEYHFYFKIKSLAIETSFNIGNAEIRFFSEDDIVQFYNEQKEANPEKTLEEFKKFYSNNFNSINICVKATGVLNRANEIAFKEAELAIDILKCFCCDYSTERLIQMFDIDYRFLQGSTSNYLQIPNGNIKDATIKINRFDSIFPVQLSSNFVKDIESKGLISFSEFIQNKKDTELYFITIDLIKQLSTIISTHNNYEKAVKAISLFESIFVPKNSSQAKGEKILKNKVIPKLISTEKERTILINLIRQYYEIRNKYLHNYIHLPLNKKDLSLLLKYQRFFILKIIELNRQYNSLSEILTYFEIQ